MNQFKTLKKLCMTALLMVSISACQEKQEEVDARQIHFINELAYKIHAQEPFTGKILNRQDFTGYLNTDIYLNKNALRAGETVVLLRNHFCEMQVKDGLLDGQLTCYNQGDQKFFEAVYVNGLKQGRSLFRDPQTGTLLIETEWANDQKNGVEILYGDDGIEINAKTHWSSGRKSGVEQIYNLATKKLISDITWNHGHEQQVKRWDATGEHLLQNYTVNQGKKTGFMIHERGGHRSEKIYQDGKLHGVQNYYQTNSDQAYQLVRVEPYDMGLKHGAHTTFDLQGHLLEEVQYNKGVAISVLTQTWQDGVLREKSNYINTVVEESYRSSYFNEVHKDDFVKHGQTLKYDENGKIIVDLLWDNGLKISGIAQSWYEGTEQLRDYCERHQDSEDLSRIEAQEWTSNGQLIAQTQWIETPVSHDIHSIVILDQGWSNSGQLRYEIRGDANGMFVSRKIWTVKGVLTLDEAWENTNKIHHRTWNTKGEPLLEKIWQNAKLRSFKSWDTLNHPDATPVLNKEFTYDDQGNIVKAWILDFSYDEHIKNEATELYRVDARSEIHRIKTLARSSYAHCRELFTNRTDAYL